MKGSRNELSALFKQAFEGLNFDFGSYESAADMIIWAQMHGLNSFEFMRKRLPDFEQQCLCQLGQCTLETKEDSRGEEQAKDKKNNNVNSVIDAKGNSSIVAAAMALDIAYVEAIKRGVAKATILNCRDRKLAIKKLVDCASSGVVCLAYWHDGETLHVVTSDTGVCCPEYSEYPLKDLASAEYLSEQHQQTLFVVCAVQAMGLQEYIANYLPELKGSQRVVMLPAMMKSYYSAALTNGIEIDKDFWKELAILGQDVLVKSTEQSRMGAGA